MSSMRIFTLLALTVLTNGYPVYQQSVFPLTGYYQPLTISAIPSAAVQSPAQPQSAALTAPPVAPPAPASPPQPSYIGPAAVVNNVKPDGTYSFGYQTPDGQMRAETVAADGTTHGTYTYRTPEGQLVTINYTAGKNGFQTSPGAPAAPAAAPQQVVATTTPAPVVAVTAVPAVAQPQSATPLVVYSLPYYPFSGLTAAQAVQMAPADQTASASSNAERAQVIQPQEALQDQNAGAIVSSPVGFAYGSNPQAIQQLQRLLLV